MAFPSRSMGIRFPATVMDPSEISTGSRGEAAIRHASAKEGTVFPSKTRNSRARR